MDIKNWIRENLLDSSGKIPPKRCSTSWWESRQDAWNHIHEITSFLPHRARLSQRIHAIQNDLKSIPKCPVCQNDLPWLWTRTYQTSCSASCGAKIKRHTINPMHVPENIEKLKLKLSSRTKEEIQNSNEKRKKTNVQKYGVDTVTQLPETINKRKKKMNELYGVDHYAQSAHFKEAARKRTKPELLDIELLERLHHDEKLSHRQIAEKFNVSESSINHWFKKHGLEVMQHYSSIPETEIYEYIIAHHPDAMKRCRHSEIGELDIFIPSLNKAIEFNGLFWHSGSPHRHVRKTNACEKHGIQLYQIFEHEWNDPVKKDIWKSILQFDSRHSIFARKTEVKEIFNPMEFFNQNHLQGSHGASVCYGLYYDDRLVSAMSFSKPRFNKKYDWEIIRYVTEMSTTVIGGAGKLLKAFQKGYNPRSILTYADRRFSNGNVYKMIGFDLVGYSKPSYFYWKGKQILSRYSCQKKKLSSLLENYDPELTERENMEAHGYRCVWDCGNVILTKTKFNDDE